MGEKKLFEYIKKIAGESAQMHFSKYAASTSTGMSNTSCYNHLKSLERSGFISVISNTKGSIVKINKEFDSGKLKRIPSKKASKNITREDLESLFLEQKTDSFESILNSFLEHNQGGLLKLKSDILKHQEESFLDLKKDVFEYQKALFLEFEKGIIETIKIKNDAVSLVELESLNQPKTEPQSDFARIEKTEKKIGKDYSENLSEQEYNEAIARVIYFTGGAVRPSKMAITKKFGIFYKEKEERDYSTRAGQIKHFLNWLEKKHRESALIVPEPPPPPLPPQPQEVNIFVPPNIEELEKQFESKGYDSAHAENFFKHHQSNNWIMRRNKPMKDWRKAVSLWIKNLNIPPDLQRIDKKSPIGKMLEIFLKHKPDYWVDKKDEPSLLLIAYNIATYKKLDRQSILNENLELMLSSWDDICKFIIEDEFYKKQTLTAIHKMWQNVITKYNSSKAMLIGSSPILRNALYDSIIEIFKKSNENYFSIINNDYKAIEVINKHITEQGEMELIPVWEQISSFIPTDKFFMGMTLIQIANKPEIIQSLFHRIKNQGVQAVGKIAAAWDRA